VLHHLNTWLGLPAGDHVPPHVKLKIKKHSFNVCSLRPKPDLDSNKSKYRKCLRLKIRKATDGRGRSQDKSHKEVKKTVRINVLLHEKLNAFRIHKVLSRIRYVYPGSRIRISFHPGSRAQKGTDSRIRNTRSICFPFFIPTYLENRRGVSWRSLCRGETCWGVSGWMSDWSPAPNITLCKEAGVLHLLASAFRAPCRTNR
jgi:hypothetical protein